MFAKRFDGGSDPVGGPAWKSVPSALIWLLAGTLLLYSVVLFSFGLWRAWGRSLDPDMQTRLQEYGWFRQGLYPDSNLEQLPLPAWPMGTVYPPYAFPMFAFFFEPGGLIQGRILVETLSLASLVLMGMYAHRRLSSHGPAIAAVGAVCGAAIAGNTTAIGNGQFSIICMGLLVQMMIFLEKNRPLAAGICWTLAMIKPQIALPFSLLFFSPYRVGGLLTGIAMLVGLSLFSSWQTGVPPAEICDFWFRRMSLRFSETGFGLSPGALAAKLHIDHRTMYAALFGLAAAFAVPLTVVVLRRQRAITVLPIASIASVLGMILIYHVHYDAVMLFPALLTCLIMAAAGQRWCTSVCGLMMLSLVIPRKLIASMPGFAWHEAAQAAVWIAAAGVAAGVVYQQTMGRATPLSHGPPYGEV